MQTPTAEHDEMVKSASRRGVSPLAAMLRSAISGGGDGETPVDLEHRVALVLYVSDSVYSANARATLESVLSDYDPEQVGLTIVHVSDPTAGARADADGIVATPTLVKSFPGPKMWIAGSLEDGEVVRRLLDGAAVAKKQ